MDHNNHSGHEGHKADTVGYNVVAIPLAAKGALFKIYFKSGPGCSAYELKHDNRCI